MAETRYTRDHEWVRLEEDGTVTVGITDHAQEILGEVVSVELPEADRDVVEGEACATVESAGASIEVFAPLAGRIAEANDGLLETPELVNRDPEGEGWLWRMEPDDEEAFEALLDEEGYEAFLETL
jgi:glycine cleavage system H protein